MMMGRRQQ
jgi:hypothetical protein